MSEYDFQSQLLLFSRTLHRRMKHSLSSYRKRRLKGAGRGGRKFRVDIRTIEW